MEVKKTSSIVIIFVTLFCGSKSSVLSGLAGFGFSPLEHDACEGKHSDSRTCYVTQVTNISCFNAEVNLDKCKKQSSTFNSDVSSTAGFKNWTHLQAYYHRHNGGRHRPGNIGSCLELKPGICKQFQCLKKCCEGWMKDKNGDCIPDVFICHNGGTYQWNGHRCNCLPGFSGKHCEIALCPGGCLNGGQCTVRADGNNVCVCPWRVSGDNCEKVDCKYQCENGGQCVLDGPTPVCRCQPGFYGRNCAHSYINDPTCPPPDNTICLDLSCRDQCATDHDCTSGHVCCSDGCCLKCVKPRPPGCWNNGVLYQPLDVFRKDNCTECMCFNNGSSQCFIKPLSYADDHCCYFDCKENTTPRPIVHKKPTLNCSNDVIKVPVYKFSNLAYMRTLMIQAKDENGTILNVKYTPSFIILHKVPVSRRNIYMIKVFARDSLGQTNVCYQRVLVVDRTSPEFVSCPADSTVTIPHHSTFTPIRPRARDNVGIQSMVCYPPDREEHMTGTYIISCTASDFDGNKVYCKTTVTVIRLDGSNDRTPPKFLRCPIDIYASEGESVSWSEPRAYDDHGVRTLVSNYDPHTVFPVGWTRVKYTATDYNNNQGHCSFFVIVSAESTDTLESSQSNMSNTARFVIAGVCSLVVILVIALVFIVIWRRYRKKPVQRSRSIQSGNTRRQNTIPTISNALYDSMALGLDGRPIVPTLKPPPYSPANEPPSYEEVFANPSLHGDATVENSREDPPSYEAFN